MHSYENEPIVVQRDVKAVAIPAGVEVNLKVGSVGYITQALGGSFTVYIDGNLFRIAGQEADAIGKTVTAAPEVPPGATEEDLKGIIWRQLKTCYDPEIPVNIVDLGLVYECDVTKNQDVRDKVEIVPTVARANVELVFEPPWNQTMMSDEARLQTGMM
jgi:metal-sulfur cluster biosynthetic enzyme